jgi:hypothetical protein
VTAGGSTALNVQSLATTAPGAYVITVTGTGPFATHSTSYTLNVKAAGALSLSCALGPNHNLISCTRQLTSGASAITDAPITITYQPPAPGTATVHTATTTATGSYSDSLVGAPGALLASGGWSVQAQYAGDSTHAAASNAQPVMVP